MFIKDEYIELNNGLVTMHTLAHTLSVGRFAPVKLILLMERFARYLLVSKISI